MATQQSRQQAQGRGKNGITIWMALASEGEQRKQQIQHATRRVLGTHHLDDRDGLRARACRPRPLSRRRDARASELSGRGVSQQRMPASHDLRPFEERATHTRRIEARLELRDAQGAPEEHKRTELPAQRRCGRTRRRGRADGGASLRRLFGDPCGVPEAVGPRRTRAIDAQERLVTSGAPETKQGAAPARECEKVPCAAAHHHVTLENDGGGFEADVAAECGRALARCRAGEARKQLRAGVGTARARPAPARDSWSCTPAPTASVTPKTAIGCVLSASSRSQHEMANAPLLASSTSLSAGRSNPVAPITPTPMSQYAGRSGPVLAPSTSPMSWSSSSAALPALAPAKPPDA